MYKRINELGYQMILSDDAKQFLVAQGYDPQFGARPLKRAIQSHIEDGLSDLLLSEDLPEGRIIHVSKNEAGDGLSMKIVSAEE